eukprot:4247152-Pyramimonas_sp.AAC.2
MVRDSDIKAVPPALAVPVGGAGVCGGDAGDGARSAAQPQPRACQSGAPRGHIPSMGTNRVRRGGIYLVSGQLSGSTSASSLPTRGAMYD